MDYYVGENYEMEKKITENDVYIFAGNCGDFNPIHLDDNYAKKSMFQRRVVHGALLNSYISAVIGMYLPGLGTIYLAQESKFLKPVFLDERIRISIEIIDINDRRRAHLETIVTNQFNDVVLRGIAYVILPDKRAKLTAENSGVETTISAKPFI